MPAIQNEVGSFGDLEASKAPEKQTTDRCPMGSKTTRKTSEEYYTCLSSSKAFAARSQSLRIMPSQVACTNRYAY